MSEEPRTPELDWPFEVWCGDVRTDVVPGDEVVDRMLALAGDGYYVSARPAGVAGVLSASPFRLCMSRVPDGLLIQPMGLEGEMRASETPVWCRTLYRLARQQQEESHG